MTKCGPPASPQRIEDSCVFPAKTFLFVEGWPEDRILSSVCSGELSTNRKVLAGNTQESSTGMKSSSPNALRVTPPLGLEEWPLDDPVCRSTPDYDRSVQLAGVRHG